MTVQGISHVLTELEHDGIVEKIDRRDWQLTSLGRALEPILTRMFDWGELAQKLHSDVSSS
jgi:DNA-binding HxlR family transcriptional regulator